MPPTVAAGSGEVGPLIVSGEATWTWALIEVVGLPPDAVNVTVQLYEPAVASEAVFRDAATVAGVGPLGDPRVSQLQLGVGEIGAEVVVKLTPDDGSLLATDICCA